MEFVEAVYDALWGLPEKDYEVEGVTDIFAPGMICADKYEQMLMACERLNRRLGDKGEDRDVEIVVDSRLSVCREIGKGMYACGKKLG